MRYRDERYHWQVEFETRECTIPADELTRMQQSLAPLGEAVADLPSSELQIKVIHHPRSATYHVEARLKLPGQTLFAGDRDTYLDTAFQRCIPRLIQRVAAYQQYPNRRTTAVAERLTALERDVVAPEDPDAGPLAAAVEAGDYLRFRTALVGYEDWLRKRVGRWIQRYPEAEVLVGNGLALGDLVEEVYLNAFEQFSRRSTEVPFREWLDGLIAPSLKVLLRHPDEERENASLVRSLRETPVAQR